MDKKSSVYKALDKLGLTYEVIDHPAVFTVEEMEKVPFPAGTVIAKNLFLRDAKGKRHFLVSVQAHRAVDLRALEGLLGSTKLSFASEERLTKYLGLTKGSVSPFGLLNDGQNAVEFFLDEGLAEEKHIGFHPNENTATVLLSGEDLLRLIRETGHEAKLLRL